MQRLLKLTRPLSQKHRNCKTRSLYLKPLARVLTRDVQVARWVLVVGSGCGHLWLYTTKAWNLLCYLNMGSEKYITNNDGVMHSSSNKRQPPSKYRHASSRQRSWIMWGNDKLSRSALHILLLHELSLALHASHLFWNVWTTNARANICFEPKQEHIKKD